MVKAIGAIAVINNSTTVTTLPQIAASPPTEATHAVISTTVVEMVLIVADTATIVPSTEPTPLMTSAYAAIYQSSQLDLLNLQKRQ